MVLILSLIIVLILFKIIEKSDNFAFMIVTLFMCLILVLSAISALTSLIVPIFIPKQYIKTNTVDIIALNDSQNMQGSSFIGSGYVDEELKYYVMQDTNLGYSVIKIDSDNAYIKEDKDQKPHIEIQTEEIENPILRYWFNFNCGGTRYIIYVPNGTIVQNYKIDLK